MSQRGAPQRSRSHRSLARAIMCLAPLSLLDGETPVLEARLMQIELGQAGTPPRCSFSSTTTSALFCTVSLHPDSELRLSHDSPRRYP